MDIIVIIVWFVIGIVWMCLGIQIGKNSLELGRFWELKRQREFLSYYEKEEYKKLLKYTLAYLVAYLVSTFFVALPFLLI